jgi:hypothetical protein
MGALVQVRYGAYFHPPGEVDVKIDRDALWEPSRQALVYRETWTLSGTMIGEGPDDLAYRCQLLQAAYQNGQSAATVSLVTGLPLQVLNHDASMSGVTVVRPPSFPKGDGAEFATERNFVIVLQADYEAVGASHLVDFRETISLMGGGPRRVWVPTITGRPRRQIITEYTTYKCTQQGSAIGRRARPQEPVPLYPDLEDQDRRNITKGGGTRIGLDLRNFPISWSYFFESDQPFDALPNEWPLTLSL